MTRSHTIRVQLGERSYDVVVGSGVRSQVFSALPSTARRALVITQDGIPFAIADDLKSAGLSVSTLTIGDGEEHKSLSTIEAIMV